jgi:hypothetical protein
MMVMATEFPGDDGYAIYERVFERVAMSKLLDTLSAVEIVRTKAGARHLFAVSAVRELALDHRLVESPRDSLVTALHRIGQRCLTSRRPRTGWLCGIRTPPCPFASASIRPVGGPGP